MEMKQVVSIGPFEVMLEDVLKVTCHMPHIMRGVVVACLGRSNIRKRLKSVHNMSEGVALINYNIRRGSGTQI